ncbi:hypothetical protein A2U01_0079732, partial [Trifolium medium]|nr:hypothetical protein [Trifolium medium]
GAPFSPAVICSRTIHPSIFYRTSRRATDRRVRNNTTVEARIEIVGILLHHPYQELILLHLDMLDTID